MAIRILAIAVLLSATVPAMAVEQFQDRQQQQMACESDVYTFCGQAIPDEERIASCLRAHWDKVSKSCRSVMANYAKQRHKKKQSD
jgi:hypothetical protein